MGSGRTEARRAREATGSRFTGNGIGLILDEGSGEGEAFDLSLPPEAGTGTDGPDEDGAGADRTGTDATGKDGPDEAGAGEAGTDGTGAKEPAP